MKDPRDIIKRPVITEESSELMANKRYVFEVDLKATKTEIKSSRRTDLQGQGRESEHDARSGQAEALRPL